MANNLEGFIVQLYPGDGDPIQWVEDLHVPVFGNPLNDKYPQMTNDRARAWIMSKQEAEVIARLLICDGEVSVIRA